MTILTFRRRTLRRRLLMMFYVPFPVQQQGYLSSNAPLTVRWSLIKNISGEAYVARATRIRSTYTKYYYMVVSSLVPGTLTYHAQSILTARRCLVLLLWCHLPPLQVQASEVTLLRCWLAQRESWLVREIPEEKETKRKGHHHQSTIRSI